MGMWMTGCAHHQAPLENGAVGPKNPPHTAPGGGDGDDGPTHECVEFGLHGVCTAYAGPPAPGDECVEWDPADEDTCIKSEPVGE